LIALKQALRGAGKFIVILAIAFAHVWGILQLIVLGSFARTVSIRTVLAAMAAGFYACAAFAALLESVWIGPTAWITGTPYADVVQIASYTVDPFIEEAVKIIPLAMLLLWVRVIRHQWSITDCIIVGAALGSGFGLAEDLYRFSVRRMQSGPDRIGSCEGTSSTASSCQVYRERWCRCSQRESSELA
jgi:RsiW-degrading membrane proteinase PrsW (M82 family)